MSGGLESAWEPIWSKDGRQLYFRQADSPGKVWVVDIRTEGGFAASKPRLLFDKKGFWTTTPHRAWDLSPGGRGFLMVTSEPEKPQPVTEMILVQNWLEELKRLVPVK